MEKPRKFKIQNVPILAARICFEQLDPSQLFEMSMFSSKMLRKIKEAAVRCDKHSVSFTKDNPSICLNFCLDKKFEITFNRQWKDRRTSMKFSTLKDIPFSFAYNSINSIVIFCDRKILFTLLYHLYDRMASLFPTPCIDDLVVDVDTIKNFLRLLHIPEFAKCNSIQLMGHEMDVEDARFVLDSCTISKMFVLTASLKEPLRRPDIFKYTNLIIDHANWVSVDDLDNLECEHVSLKGTSITDIQVNELIHLWRVAGRYPLLKSLEIEYVGQEIPVPKDLLKIHVIMNDAVTKNQFMKFHQLVTLLRHYEAPFPMNYHSLESTCRAREQKHPNAEQMDQYHILTGFPFHQVKQSRHSVEFNRGNANFSHLLHEPDPVKMKKYDFDIKRSDGVWATLKFEKNLMKMYVHEKVPPEEKEGEDMDDE